MDEYKPGGLGRIYRPDPRDRTYSMARAVDAVGQVDSKVWHVGDTLDQGNTPQCVGYAWRHFLSAAPIMDRIGRELPSPTSIYDRAQRVDEWLGEGYDGTSVRAGAKVLRALGLISDFLWAPDLFTLKRFIVQRGPVVIGVDWFAGMGRTRGEYVVPEGQYWGGHAVLLHGWSESRRAFRGLNSWGTGWGEDGRFWLDEQDAQYLIFQANGEACSAIEIEP